MTDLFDRRQVLTALSVAGAAGLLPTGFTPAHAAGSLTLGAPEVFSFEALKAMAVDLAGKPYAAPRQPDPEIVSKIDYERWGQITFNTESALFANGPGQFPVTFFHIGKFFPKSVEMYVVDADQARPIVYNQAMFDMPANSPAKQLPQGVGFAGFRIQEPRSGKPDWHKNDWAAFLGAAYFRAIGELYQYGLSARGVAVNTAVADRDEEFPDFTRFYIETPTSDDTIVVNALLDGPSLTGAYRFQMTRGKGVTMEIEHTLNLRKDIARLGIAPLTTMYWFSETKKDTAIDWRPEVHDSDGLALWTGSGERIWRPLNNPERTTASSFSDHSPRGYGALQRDRVFDHYLDGVFYDRRPSLWVEPGSDWGAGAVQLIEIPTDDEIHDNVVATWVPAEPATAGKTYAFKYKLFWVANEPHPSPLAKCVATRLGRGGQPGLPRPAGVRKFMVEFLGGPLENLPFGVKPEAVLNTSRGTFTPYVYTEAVPDGVNGHWRAQFDLVVDGTDPVEMRCYLKMGNDILTETWAFQYHPF
ncbi:glucan biosynthesis protein D [Lichenihabitans sp. PAMC28606]|uniref:glucan biosynthesis protein n=1 Tax=Lichenihabitans sp. PAMC28606 TaxID=2880932 RepID=UPI001D0AE035|nr:glucan biosynthesis protein D [Lichenihabitans sp. PAMC28606]UDL95868.1 glucan biosynthesis protein D [Lichenihabitans sp. PAMC28606]